MANTKTITRTERGVRQACAVAALALVMMGMLFISGRVDAVLHGNNAIQSAIDNHQVADASGVAPLAVRQADLLARDPSEVFAWGRLAWMRWLAGDRAGAFEALRLSDMLSPMESTQLPERAAFWRVLRDVETSEQQAYQDKLWFKAYSLDREDTWRIAAAHGWQAEVASALARYSPSHYQEWLARMREAQPQ